VSKHDALYIEKFQPAYLLVRGSDPIPKAGILGLDFTDDFGDDFVVQVDKKKGPETCVSDPSKMTLKKTAHTKP